MIHAIGLKSATADLFPSKMVALRVKKQERAYRMAVCSGSHLAGARAVPPGVARSGPGLPGNSLKPFGLLLAICLSNRTNSRSRTEPTTSVTERRPLAHASQSKATDSVGTSARNRPIGNRFETTFIERFLQCECTQKYDLAIWSKRRLFGWPLAGLRRLAFSFQQMARFHFNRLRSNFHA